ncbi:MAG: hypothetical protein ACRC6E_02430 [Fusobacteriaceae bacterium]
MIIDSLTSTEVYVERKGLAKIFGSSTINKAGVLTVDSLENALVSNIDSGDTPLYKLDKYTGEDGLMLYNPTNKYLQIAKEGDLLKVGLDFEKGTRYYIGAKLIKSTNKKGSEFDVALNGLEVFKIFIDGRELKNYSAIGNKVTVMGSDVNVLDIFSEIIVYAFKSQSIEGNEEFEISYDQYMSIWEYDSFTDGSYIDTLLGTEVTCFESLSIAQQVGKTVYRGSGFNFANKTRLNSIDNTLELELFDAKETLDVLQWANTGEFRFILLNPTFGRCVIVNNCKIDNGINMVYDKSKNTKKVTISCGNYIDIKIRDQSEYGANKYGKGLYGSGTYVVNSHRRRT